MRLINSRTLHLEEFWDENEKKYAILSHRWGEEEVGFRAMQDITAARNLKGFEKIWRCCERAVKDKIDYVWVDTCCIKKDSDAELTEAINSMYRWYKASAVCYAFLADVNAGPFDSEALEPQIKASVWFERGWTLQELLAPTYVIFQNQRWENLGTKRKMSYLLNRITTRREDMAYCLLGIFEVNMPMLYGEGDKAFLRLQEEICRRSDDHTIFAWPINRQDQPGLLADSPKAFENCQNIRALTSRKGRSPYSLTNRGLTTKFIATQFSTDTYLVRLDCSDGPQVKDVEPGLELRLGMYLCRLSEDDQYARVKYDGKTFGQVKTSVWDQELPKNSQPVRPVEQIEVSVKQQLTESNILFYRNRINGFRIATLELLERSKDGKDKYKVNASVWDPDECIMGAVPGAFGNVGVLDISAQDRKIKAIKLGFDFEYNPVCFVAASGGMTGKTPAIDSNGKLNYRLDSQVVQWTAEEHAQHKSINGRTPFDALAWSTVTKGASGQLTAREFSQHAGLGL
ncbi:hypothetical protein MMC25_004832 [Agyrium rufum]|nr:hypothetical protein [Agyrium rufum]